MTEQVTIDWNDMSKLGLVYRINKKILHPLGLALSYNPDTGVSETVFVADDGVWEYKHDIVNKVRPSTDEEIKTRLKLILQEKNLGFDD